MSTLRKSEDPGPLLTVTEKAKEKIADLAASQDVRPGGLRIAVLGGGCSGFQYKFAFEPEPGPYDQVVDCGDVPLFIDNISACYLLGAELDWVSSLMTEGFHIRNPNAKSTCGCGLSVSF
jgi:iron-sulfur cluster assembly accessory protein